jgi:hypothetical protein
MIVFGIISRNGGIEFQHIYSWYVSRYMEVS